MVFTSLFLIPIIAIPVFFIVVFITCLLYFFGGHLLPDSFGEKEAEEEAQEEMQEEENARRRMWKRKYPNVPYQKKYKNTKANIGEFDDLFL